MNEENEELFAGDSSGKYLLFTLAGELYGAPLIGVKEVRKLGYIKPVPYMAPWFKGIINLRGQIVSVVDLRIQLELKVPSPDQGIILVVETSQGVIGAIVDDLESVRAIDLAAIERPTALDTRIPLESFLGIAKLEDRLVNLIDLPGCVARESHKHATRVSGSQELCRENK